MVKDQAHFRLEKGLLQALKDKAQEENTTTTELVSRFLKQGLGIEFPIHQGIDINQLEERVFNRISQQQEEWVKSLEKRVFDRVSELIPAIDIAVIETQALNHLSEFLPKLIEEYLAAQERISGITTNATLEPTEIASEVEESTPEANQEKRSELSQVSEVKVTIPNKAADNTSKQPPPELVSDLPLFSSIEKGTIVGVPSLVKYLNEVVDPNSKKLWDRVQLRLLKKRHFTYWNKPTAKRKDDSPLPIVINNYIIDWIPSEEEPPNSYGRQWWIQRLPQDIDDKKKLIAEKRAQWKSFYDQKAQAPK